jgi:hypothetical protein
VHCELRQVGFAWPASQQVDVKWPEGCQQRFVDEYYEKAEAAKKRVVGDAPYYCKICIPFTVSCLPCPSLSLVEK